jgi:hypothetical protein
MLMPNPRITRRDWARILAGAALDATLSRSRVFAGPLSWGAQPPADRGHERRYRADAQVLLLSVPLLRRKGVGDGSASWRESCENSIVVRMLEFTGRSLPDRAAGLNRFGFIQELSRRAEPEPQEAIYFGLMTSSPEENVEQARKALHQNAAEVGYAVIEGHLGDWSVETVSTHFSAPAHLSSVDRGELIRRARAALSGAPKSSAASMGPASVQPFLHALAEVLPGTGRAETRYAYSGRMYQLRVDKSPDPKAAAFFQERGLLTPVAAVIRVDGKLRRAAGGKETEFRLWIEDGATRPLPLRIEYQPKPYLRLTFEAEV